MSLTTSEARVGSIYKYADVGLIRFMACPRA